MINSHKGRVLLGFFVFQCLLIIAVAYYFTGNNENQSFSETDLLTEEEGIPGVKGNVIDSTVQGNGRKVTTPHFYLGLGIYDVSVDYTISNVSSDSNISAENKIVTYTEDIEDQARYTVLCDKNVLHPYNNTETYSFYINEPSTGVAVRCKVADGSNASLTVRRVSVRFLLLKTISYYLIRILFWFIMADILLFLWIFRKDRMKQWLHENGSMVAVMAGILFIAEIPLTLDYIIDAGQDLPFHCARIEFLASGLECGMFPVKIQPRWMNGYGYATGTMYGDALLYIPALLRVAGFPLRTCYKIYVLIINGLTMAASYEAFRRISRDRYIGLCGCTLYTLSIYRLCDIYTQSDLGELTAWAFLPLIILGFEMIYESILKDSTAADTICAESDGQGWLMLALGITGVLEAHIITTLLAGLFGLLFCIIMWRYTFHRSILRQLGKALFAVLILNAAFLVPFLDYLLHMDFTVKHVYNTLEQYTEYSASLFATVYGTNGLTPDSGSVGGMPLSIGIAGGVILVLAIVMLATGMTSHRRATGILLTMILLSLWLCTNLFPYRFMALHASAIYEIIAKMQYPWRFLIIASPLLCTLYIILSVDALEKFGRKTVFAAGILLCLIAGFQALNYTSQFLTDNRLDKDRRETLTGLSETFLQSGAEYVLYGTKVEDMTDSTLHTSEEGIKADIVSRKGLEIISTVENNTDNTVYTDYPLQNYKGYEAGDAEGRRLAISNGDNNRIRVSIPAGYSGTVRVYFREPWYWRAAELLSLAYLFCLLVRSRRHFCKIALARKNRVV
jgi:hypothetical protein